MGAYYIIANRMGPSYMSSSHRKLLAVMSMLKFQ